MTVERFAEVGVQLLVLRQQMDGRPVDEQRFDLRQLVHVFDEEFFGILGIQAVGAIDDEQDASSQALPGQPFLGDPW